MTHCHNWCIKGNNRWVGEPKFSGNDGFHTKLVKIIHYTHLDLLTKLLHDASFSLDSNKSNIPDEKGSLYQYTLNESLITACSV